MIPLHTCTSCSEKYAYEKNAFNCCTPRYIAIAKHFVEAGTRQTLEEKAEKSKARYRLNREHNLNMARERYQRQKKEKIK